MYAPLRPLFHIALVTGIIILVAGCSQIEHWNRSARVKQLQDEREKRTTQLKSESPAKLMERLAEQSKRGVEPWNSLAYTELVSRGESVVYEMAQHLIPAPDRSSLLGLLALKEISPAKYEGLDSDLKIKVLIDALQNSRYFNLWGLPIAGWEDAGLALIGEGKKAEHALYPLLKDNRPAPGWGSQALVEYKQYQYRVKDYALTLIYAINNSQQEIPTVITERDKLIEQLLFSGTIN